MHACFCSKLALFVPMTHWADRCKCYNFFPFLRCGAGITLCAPRAWHPSHIERRATGRAAPESLQGGIIMAG